MTMTRIVTAEWTVIPAAAPEPIRYCPSCSTARNFASSGKVRLNANGKRLDAWLIYRCTTCGQVWNRPILDRHTVGSISADDHDAMQQSDPAWVRQIEFDAAGLRAHADEIFFPPDFSIVKHAGGAASGEWSELHLTVRQRFASGLRLDRVLCEGWRLSRSQLHRLANSGNITAGARTRTLLKKPLKQALTVSVTAGGLDEDTRLKIVQGACGHGS